MSNLLQAYINGLRCAQDLATTIYEQHWKGPDDVVAWAPMNSITGALSQISNMVSGMQRRPEGEPGTLWLHYKDGSQIPFSEAAAQTIADVMKAYKPVVEHPQKEVTESIRRALAVDEADFVASLKNRDGL